MSATPVLRRDLLAPVGAALGLAIALSYIVDFHALGTQPLRILWAMFMITAVGQWFRVWRRDTTGIADQLGITIGVLVWALAWALTNG
jgi:hypothetical protein